MKTPKKTKAHSTSGERTRRLVVTAMLAAMAAALMFFAIPLPFIAPEFYKLDFSEVPVLIGGFAFGPAAGICIEFIKILIKFIIKGTSTAGVGDLANFVIGCSFIVPAALIYKFRKTRSGALIGMAVGTVTMAVLGAVINGFVLIPVYAAAFNTDVDALVDMGRAVNSSIDSVFKLCLLAVSPFNLIKGAAVSVITFLIYKPLSRVIHNNILK